MNKVLIVGAGAQGGPCAAILAGEESVSEIRLGDIDLEIATKVAKRINSKKVRPLKLDAGEKDQLIEAAEGVDVVFNFTLIAFNELIMEAALACQAHYVDTACNLDFLNRWISGEDPKYHRYFKDIGKTAVVGCGFSPGIANVLTRYACDQMDRVRSIVIRVGRSTGEDSDEVVSEWKPTWSPEILLEDYADPPMVLKAGEFVEVPIFSNPEIYNFPKPVGELLISSHSHEEPYLMPRYYLDKGLQEVDFKYPVDPLAGAFVKMGFADDAAIDVKGVQVVPRDVLMKLVKRPGNTFLLETKDSFLQSELTGILDVCVDGEQKGEMMSSTISYTFTDGSDKERQRKLFDAYGTTLVYVALPAVVGAKMCINGDVESGVITPDSLEPGKYFKGMAERGVPFKFEEKYNRQMTFHGD
jgi:saccharopine dehydrogenase-like NADP-dependent oxidoreductase